MDAHETKDDERTDVTDPAMPAEANPSSHQPTAEPGVAPGYRRHTGPGGAPGAPGNGPASPLETTPVLYDGEDEDE
ncbi:MAG TPA: hypothetical protein VFH74_07280 [Gaiellales bacterium]|nr:hypothetical protein [Gaiellales bacterium]